METCGAFFCGRPRLPTCLSAACPPLGLSLRHVAVYSGLMHSLIIHMPGDTKRASNVATLRDTLPNAQIVDAVIGKDVMATGGCAPIAGTLYRPSYPFPLSPGEVGCFLSHRACWQKIVAQDWEWALIVEDDLSVDPTLWPDALHLIADHMTPDHFIRLPAKHREAAAATVAQFGEARLFLPRVPGLQTVAQVVGRAAAARLLASTETIDRPVDTFLQMHWIHGQTIHTILPNGASELTDALGGSTIQKKSGSHSKLERELKRAVYRAQVSAHRQHM